MKKMVFVFSLALVSCAPVTQIITSIAPARIGVGRSLPAQGQLKDCSGVSYVNADRNNNIKVNDKFTFEFSNVPENVKLSPEISGNEVVLCAIASIKAIPEETNVQVKAVINDVNAIGTWNIIVRKESLADFLIASNAFAPIGGKFCIPVEARQNLSSSYSRVSSTDIAVSFSTKSLITVTLENTEKPVCFNAPANVLAGTYDIQAKGIVGGVGVNETLRIVVK